MLSFAQRPTVPVTKTATIYFTVYFFFRCMNRCLLTKPNASGTKAGSICVCAWLSKKRGQMHLLFAKAVFAALKLQVSLEFEFGVVGGWGGKTLSKKTVGGLLFLNRRASLV